MREKERVEGSGAERTSERNSRVRKSQRDSQRVRKRLSDREGPIDCVRGERDL